MLTQSSLNQFTGTENYYRHWTRRLVYTDGVKYLADEGGAYWLIDAIASYQGDKRITKHPLCCDMQFWKLKREGENGAVLTCVPDSGLASIITQNIEFTDFPLEEVDVWVERGSIDGKTECMVAMLPSER
jgi:hypothetical protein